MSSASIPLEFISNRHALTWREVDYGLREGWIGEDSAIDLAVARVERGSEDEDELDLGGVLCNERYRVAGILGRLVEKGSEQDHADVKLAWMRILLAWVYETQPHDEDALRAVEELYADFDYPDEIRHLVRYNPIDEATEGDRSVRGVIERWGKYLSERFPSYYVQSDSLRR